MRWLRHDGEKLPRVFRRIVEQVAVIDADAAGFRVPEAQQQIDDSRFARAAWTDNRQTCASAQIETDVVERERLVRRVAEAQALHTY